MQEKSGLGEEWALGESAERRNIEKPDVFAILRRFPFRKPFGQGPFYRMAPA